MLGDPDADTLPLSESDVTALVDGLTDTDGLYETKGEADDDEVADAELELVALLESADEKFATFGVGSALELGDPEADTLPLPEPVAEALVVAFEQSIVVFDVQFDTTI